MLLDVSGQMPMRTNLPATYPDYFQSHPDYAMFADQAGRTVEVPNVPNSVQNWQTFRDAYSKSVIFGTLTVEEAFPAAADQIKKLLSQ
jgi:multiple sugar transport system substrate-binding protein